MAAVVVAAFVAFGQVWVVTSQDQVIDTVETFDKRSLQLRTVLHRDPLLRSALDALVGLYRDEERFDELIGLYQSHVEQYPSDAGAKTVLIQLLQKGNRDEVAELIASAVQLHADFAPLQYVLFEYLEQKGDERAVEALSRAIELEVNPARRSEWFEDLLERTGQEKARVFVERELMAVLEQEGLAKEELFSLTRLMQRYRFWELSLATLDKLESMALDAEAEVEESMLSATALSELGRLEEAGAELDGLIERLAVDHWRRREVMSMRFAVVATEEERAALLERLRVAHEANPMSEAATLDYAEMLIASERQSDASELLVESASILPESSLIETRAIELLKSINNDRGFEAFLEERLEVQPDRSDLRFELVKVKYSLEKDADAEQDFKAVIAGLSSEEASLKILELQRFLIGIDRAEAAAPYLEQYLRNHPERLDVAGELAELFLEKQDYDAVEILVGKLEPEKAALENVIDLAELLLGEELYEAARQVIEAKRPTSEDSFDLELLFVRTLGELGNAAGAANQITRSRERADTPERYARWLDASVEAHERLETVSRFLESEQNRFSFSEGDWPEDKLEKFILLCETGRERLSTDRITGAIREQLEKASVKPALKTRLRRFLVELLGNNPDAAQEIEVQLEALMGEDPDRSADYGLRMGLLHYQIQRVDLAQREIPRIEWGRIESPNLIREAVEALLAFKFLPEAAEALAALNRLEPEDLFGWTRRLSLLVAMSRESEFRDVVRTLRSGDAGVALSNETEALLTDHLIASYWRSVSRTISNSSEESIAEVLPLLGSLDREIKSPNSRAWVEWMRWNILSQLGMEKETMEAENRFDSIIRDHKLDQVSFPDGLSLEVANAKAQSFEGELHLTGTLGAEDLLNEPRLVWVFELPAERQILEFHRSGSKILVLDDHGMVYGLDPESGKLLWKTSNLEGRRPVAKGRPTWFNQSPLSRNPASLINHSAIRTGNSLLPYADRFVVLLDGRVRCFSEDDAQLIWEATLPFGAISGDNDDVFRGDLMDLEGNQLVVFRPASQAAACISLDSGKLIWVSSAETTGEANPLFVNAVSSGLAVEGGRVFLYGKQTAVHDLETGEIVWRFRRQALTSFPVQLKKDRGVELVASQFEGDLGDSLTVSRDLQHRLIGLDVLDPEQVMNSRLHIETSVSGSFVSPAVNWAAARGDEPEPAMAHLSGGYFWLARGNSLRRVSSTLPVGAVELPAKGVFLGQNDNHAWFLDEGNLIHVDYYRVESQSLEIGDLGPAVSIRAVFSDAQLLITGSLGFKLVNTKTGMVIQRGKWPSEILNYTDSRFAAEAEQRLIWQGRIARHGRQNVPYCRSVLDLIHDSHLFSAIDLRTLICVGPPSQSAPSDQP
ncbi:MAG: PQQ-binding-like beta-propeller repeat protein [Verrucomicrobiota bacterium]